MRIKPKILLVSIASLALFACDTKPSLAQGQPPSAPTAKNVDVEVGARGFVPNHVALNKGQRSTLTFKRTSKEGCAKKVVFPDLEIEKDLPLGESVEIEIPTGQSRTLLFQCGMGMYKSHVLITES